MKSLLPYSYITLASIIWSGNFIIARGMADIIPPLTMSFGRWLIAALFLLPFALKPCIKEWHIIKNHLPILALQGLFGVALFNTLAYFAGHTTESMNISLIAVTSPMFVVIWTRLFYKESVHPMQAAGLCLALFSVANVITRGNITLILELNFTEGDLWILGGSLCWSIYVILLRYRPVNLSMPSFLLSTITFGLAMIIPFWLWEMTTEPLPVFNLHNSLVFLYLGLGASLAAFYLFAKSVEVIGGRNTSIGYLTIPVFNAVLASQLLGEQLTLTHVLAFLGIFTGIYFAAIRKYNH